MQDIVAEFFSEEHIVRTVHTMLTTNRSENSDPIVHVLLQLLTLPLVFAVTDVGLAPLRNDTTVIVPFSAMTRRQLETIETTLAGLRVRQTYVANMQMGGGLYVRAVGTPGERVVLVDPALVIFASNVLIRNSVSVAHNKKNVSNIVIQRVLGAMAVRHDKVVEAERLSQAHFAAHAGAGGRPTVVE